MIAPERTQDSGERGDGDERHRARNAAEPLRDLARGALCRALLADGRTRQPDANVRELLRQACNVARARDMHVEHVLILLKEVWHELPELQLGRQGDAETRFARVVSLCIEEYYANRAD